MKDPSRFGFLSLLIPAPGEPPCLKWKHRNEAPERNIPLLQYSTFLQFNNVLMLSKDDRPEQAALGLSLSLTNFRRAPEALRHSCWGIQILTTNCALQLADGKARTLVYFRKWGSSSWFMQGVLTATFGIQTALGLASRSIVLVFSRQDGLGIIHKDECVLLHVRGKATEATPI